MIGRWVKIKYQIPIDEIRILCDSAIEVEKAKRLLEREIAMGYIYPFHFWDFIMKGKRLVINYVSTVRKFIKGGAEMSKDVKEALTKLEKDVIVYLTFDEVDKRDLLKGSISVNLAAKFIDRINDLLGRIEGTLDAVIRRDTDVIKKTFVIESMLRAGITPSFKFMKAFGKGEEIASME